MAPSNPHRYATPSSAGGSNQEAVAEEEADSDEKEMEKRREMWKTKAHVKAANQKLVAMQKSAQRFRVEPSEVRAAYTPPPPLPVICTCTCTVASPRLLVTHAPDASAGSLLISAHHLTSS